MKFDECFGKFSRNPCPHYHPSNCYDKIYEQLDSFARQRCWCMLWNFPVREVCEECNNSELYSLDIHITGKLDLHIADSTDDVLEYINKFFPRRGITVEDIKCNFTKLEESEK